MNKVDMIYSGPEGAEKDIAVQGPCRFRVPANEFFGGHLTKEYVSGVVDSPTWENVLEMAQESMSITRDFSHYFLEGVRLLEVGADCVPIYGMYLGS